MTAYLALQELPLAKRVRAAPYAAIPGESLLGLRAGERISVRDLLYGLILRSGNDAAETLAVAAAGSEPRFVRQMNLRAAALGLADTHYSNPIGLDEPGNYSSAADLLALSRRLLEIPAFARIARSRSAVLRSLRPPETIYTRNTLLLRAGWANGVKTGHTLGAGYVLVGSGRRDGVELISAVLGAPSEGQRDTESLDLLDYGFSLVPDPPAPAQGQGGGESLDPLLGRRAAASRGPHGRGRAASRPAAQRRGARPCRGRGADPPEGEDRLGDRPRRWPALRPRASDRLALDPQGRGLRPGAGMGLGACDTAPGRRVRDTDWRGVIAVAAPPAAPRPQ